MKNSRPIKYFLSSCIALAFAAAAAPAQSDQLARNAIEAGAVTERNETNKEDSTKTISSLPAKPSLARVGVQTADPIPLSIDEAITMAAEVQAICMKTNDFHRAYEAFANKRKPEFQGD